MDSCRLNYKWLWVLCVSSLSLILGSCERQSEPIRIGMIASITGRTADVGIASRDGSLLAVEQVNQTGGILGHPIELLVRDIGQDPEQAVQVLHELDRQDVFVSIGPVLSSMALVLTPYADDAGMLLVSPTVSTNWLSDKDDFFLRVYPQCRDTARALAGHVSQKQHRRIVVMLEQRNKAFTESWRNCFKEKFEQTGGEVVSSVGFISGENQGFFQLTATALQENPDGLLILGSAIDSALIAQQVAKEKPGLKIYVSEWSFTRDFLKHGGRAVEGVSLFHSTNEQSQSPRYLIFVEAFKKRFGRAPSFPAIHAYDATSLVLGSLQRGARTGDDVKQDLLHQGELETLQAELSLNKFGDVKRTLYLTEVRNGEFVVISELKQSSE